MYRDLCDYESPAHMCPMVQWAPELNSPDRAGQRRQACAFWGRTSTWESLSCGWWRMATMQAGKPSVKSSVSGAKQTWIIFLALPLSICRRSDNSFNLSALQFPHLSDRSNNRPNCPGMVQGWNENIYELPLALRLAQHKHSINEW